MVTDWKQQAEYLAEALNFYADPETYFAIGLFPDPPCGPFIDDISWVDHEFLPDYRPGKLAREVLAAFMEVCEQDGQPEPLPDIQVGSQWICERAIHGWKRVIVREVDKSMVRIDIPDAVAHNSAGQEVHGVKDMMSVQRFLHWYHPDE